MINNFFKLKTNILIYLSWWFMAWDMLKIQHKLVSKNQLLASEQTANGFTLNHNKTGATLTSNGKIWYPLKKMRVLSAAAAADFVSNNKID